jgi:hypothetical protein
MPPGDGLDALDLARISGEPMAGDAAEVRRAIVAMTAQRVRRRALTLTRV